MTKVAIFASGSGSNAENIALHFKGSNSVIVDCIISNKSDAYVLERAKKMGIESAVFSGKCFAETDEVLNYLHSRGVDFIVLAGFLLKVPQNLLDAYPRRIVNIHPALLPKFGGKGMYGSHVHEAVIAAGETETGITIHFINENYDEGDIIFQASCPVLPTDTPDSVAEKVHRLEYQYFPTVIADTIEQLKASSFS